MIRTKIYLLGLVHLFSGNIICHAQNILSNGGFEEGADLPTAPGQLNKCNYWEREGDEETHTADWYHTSSFTGYTGSDGHNASNGFVGILQYEVIQQDIPFSDVPKPGHIPYILEMYIKLDEQFPTGGVSTYWSDSYLRVYLSKQKIKYKSDDYNESCTNDYITHKVSSGPTEEIFSVFLNPNDFEYGNWHRIRKLFYAPGNINDLDKYNWFAIEVTNNLAFQGSYGEQCFDGYVLIDDVSIYSYCDQECAPNLLPVTIYQSANATYGFSAGCQSAPYGAHPATWIIGNAIGYELRVFDGWGGQQYFCSEKNLYGLDNPNITAQEPSFINPWFVTWNGINDQGNFLVDDVYAYELIIYNCNGTFVKNGTITKVGDCGTNPIIVEDCFTDNSSAYDLDWCCPYCRTLTLAEPYGNEQYKAQSCIVCQDNFYPPTGYNTEVRAGDYVRLSHGFHAFYGSTFHAYIEECAVPQFRGTKIGLPWQYQAIRDTSHWELNYINEDNFSTLSEQNNITDYFSLNPNPNEGEFVIQWLGVGLQSIEVYDIVGSRVFYDEDLSGYSVDIQLDNLTSGTYLVKVIGQTQEIKTERIVIY